MVAEASGVQQALTHIRADLVGDRERLRIWERRLGALERRVANLGHARGPDSRPSAHRPRPTEQKPSGTEPHGLATRLARLESSVEETQTRVAMGMPSAREDQPLALERYQAAMDRDRANHTTEEWQEINRLYSLGMRGLRQPEGREALESLIDRFPESNRAGCAAMNLASVLYGDGDHDAARAHLETLIEAESDAVFRNGERILAKALVMLGRVEQHEGRGEEAHALWSRVTEDFPNEEDARGVPYGQVAEQHLEELAP